MSYVKSLRILSKPFLFLYFMSNLLVPKVYAQDTKTPIDEPKKKISSNLEFSTDVSFFDIFRDNVFFSSLSFDGSAMPMAIALAGGVQENYYARAESYVKFESFPLLSEGTFSVIQRAGKDNAPVGIIQQARQTGGNLYQRCALELTGKTELFGIPMYSNFGGFLPDGLSESPEIYTNITFSKRNMQVIVGGSCNGTNERPYTCTLNSQIGINLD